MGFSIPLMSAPPESAGYVGDCRVAQLKPSLPDDSHSAAAQIGVVNHERKCWVMIWSPKFLSESQGGFSQRSPLQTHSRRANSHILPLVTPYRLVALKRFPLIFEPQ